MADVQSNQSGGGLDPKLAGALSYLCGWLSGVIILLMEKENKEVKFHAWQSIFMSLAAFVYFFVTFILGFVPFVGILIGLINIFVALGLFAVIIICMIKAFQGGRFAIPVISQYAEQQANK